MDNLTQDFEIFDANKSLAYPSANALNGGELNSEENLRMIMYRLTRKSFVMRMNDGDFDISFSGSNLTIQPGQCNIDGYYFKCSIMTELNLVSLNNSGEQTISSLLNSDGSDTTLYLYLIVKRDSSHHILCYDSDTTTSPFKGVVLSFSNKELEATNLLLGTISVNKNLTIKKCEINVGKYSFLDADTIYVDNNEIDAKTLYDLIAYYIKKQIGQGMQCDMTIMGPDPSNPDGTSNLYITNTNKDSLLRLYYDANKGVGGLATYDKAGKLITNIFNFNELLNSNNAIVITPKLTIQNAMSVNGTSKFNNTVTIKSSTALNVEGNTTIKGNIDQTGNLIVSDTIQGKTVIGAVWG